MWGKQTRTLVGCIVQANIWLQHAKEPNWSSQIGSLNCKAQRNIHGNHFATSCISVKSPGIPGRIWKTMGIFVNSCLIFKSPRNSLLRLNKTARRRKWFVISVSIIRLLPLWQFPLHWRRNGRDGVSNHQHRGCLLNRWFGHRSKKTSKLRVTDLCAGNSPGTGEFRPRWIPGTNGQ